MLAEGGVIERASASVSRSLPTPRCSSPARPLQQGPSFAESPSDDCRASATELAEGRRLGKWSDRLDVARRAEHHGEVNANEALLQLVQSAMTR